MQSPESEFLQLLFASLHRQGIKYAIAREWDSLPDSLGGSDLDILTGCEADMHIPFVQRCGCLNRLDTQLTMFAMRVDDDTVVQIPHSVRYLHRISRRTTQDLHTMIAFFFGKNRRLDDIGRVEKVHYNSDSFKRSAFSATCRASMTPWMSPSMNAARLYTV